MLVVQHLPLDTTSDLRHFSALFLPVVRPVFFPRELALLATEQFVVVFEVEPIHGFAVAGVDVVADTEVDTHAVARVQRVYRGFLRQVSIVGFQTEGDEPLASRLFPERGFFDGGVVGDRPRVPDFDPLNLTEAHVGVLVVTPLFIEVEARLVVRDAPVVAGCLPLETTNFVSLLFLFTKV